MVFKIGKVGGLFGVFDVVVVCNVVGIGLYGGMLFEGIVGIIVVLYVWLILFVIEFGIEMFGLFL